MRLRSLLPLCLVTGIPAAALAAGLGPPLATPPTPDVPLGPVEIGGRPETPPVAAPPIDLVLPDRASHAFGRSRVDLRAVLGLPARASTARAARHRAALASPLWEWLDTNRRAPGGFESTTVIIRGESVPEPSTVLLLLLGLSGLALRRR